AGRRRLHDRHHRRGCSVRLAALRLRKGRVTAPFFMGGETSALPVRFQGAAGNAARHPQQTHGRNDMRIHVLSRVATALTIGTMLAAASPAFAEMVKMSATMDAAQEVPPNDSAGKGTADISFDTESKQLDWTIEYSGLTGDATGAHFHGP